MFLKHYSKPYDADFVFVEIDKMLVSSYFFIETKKTREIKKNWNQLWRHINFDVITEIKGSWCYVTMKMCELSPRNLKPDLKLSLELNRVNYIHRGETSTIYWTEGRCEAYIGVAGTVATKKKYGRLFMLGKYSAFIKEK